MELNPFRAYRERRTQARIQEASSRVADIVFDYHCSVGYEDPDLRILEEDDTLRISIGELPKGILAGDFLGQVASRALETVANQKFETPHIDGDIMVYDSEKTRLANTRNVRYGNDWKNEVTQTSDLTLVLKPTIPAHP